MKISYCDNNIVNEIGTMNLSGNIIPETWYKAFSGVKKTTIPLMTLVLAEIVYWYRPTEVRDEYGNSVSFTKKFYDADFLQINYDKLADKFCVSKRQITAAIVALEKYGVIKRHIRTIITKTGRTISNTVFVELIPSVLKSITYDNDDTITSQCNRYDNSDDTITPQCDRYDKSNNTITSKNARCDIEMSDVSQHNVTGLTSECETYTENTSETSKGDFPQSFQKKGGTPASLEDLKQDVSNFLFEQGDDYVDYMNNAFLQRIIMEYGLNKYKAKEIAAIQTKYLIGYDSLLSENACFEQPLNAIVDIISDILADTNQAKRLYSDYLEDYSPGELKNKLYMLNNDITKSIILRFIEQSDRIINKKKYLLTMILKSDTDYSLEAIYYSSK